MKAVIARDTDGYKVAIEDLRDEDLPANEVLVDVAYSSLNYKDALAVTGRGKIVRRFPMVLGIDLAGAGIIRDVALLAICGLSLWRTPAAVRAGNNFTWAPMAEVARLFAGIFVTIIAPLAILRAGHDGALGGEDLGVQPCDGLICSTPSGSTAYNLSNGGPVLVRGLEAMAITFIAPHSLHARPMVVPRGLELVIRNETDDVDVSVLVDGHALADVGVDSPIVIGLGGERSLLATLPEATFFRRYRETFGS